MKRMHYPLFAFLVSTLFSITAKAQVFNIPQTFNGSLLCGEIVTHITKLPASLRTFDLTDKVIVSDTVYRTTYISYYYETPAIIIDPLPGDTVRLDTTIMNPYFRKDNRYVAPNPQWAVVQKFFLNGDSAAPTKVEFGTPYAPCVNYTYNCDELNVYRHVLRDICPSSISKLTKNYTIKDDSIHAIFTDTIIPQVVICLAVGYMTHTDTITIPLTSLTPAVYQVGYEQIVKQKVECLVAPCPDSTIKKRWIGVADLGNCIPNGIDKSPNEANRNLLYPNPATEKVYLKGVEGAVMLTDQLGVSYILQGVDEYSLKGLPAGVYMATYVLNGKQRFQKLVVF